MRAWRRFGFVLALWTASALFCPGLPLQAASTGLPMPGMPQGRCHEPAPLSDSTPACCIAAHHLASRPEAPASVIPALVPARVVLPQPVSILTVLHPPLRALYLGSPPGPPVLRV